MPIELAEESAATDLTAPPADEVTTALVEVTKTNTKITELAALGHALAKKYTGVVADVRTTKGYDQIAAIRTELRESVRYPMQALQDTGSKMLGTMQRQFNVRAKQYIEEAKAHETPFQEQLDAEDKRKKDAKDESDRVEAERKQMHQDGVTAIALNVTNAMGLDVAGLEGRIAAVEAIAIDEQWEEYQGQAQQAKDEALRQLNGMLVAERIDAAERMELEQERTRQAQFREQQAAQQKLLGEQAAELQRQRNEMALQQLALNAQREQQERAIQERKEAVQARIDALANYGAAFSYMAASADIEIYLRTLQDTLLYHGQYDDRVAEAEAARAGALERLRAVFDAAVAREAEERKQAVAAQIQVNLNNLAAYGNWEPDASAQFFVDRIEALNDEPLTEEYYGDRLQEALALHLAVLDAVGAAQREAVAREQREAEEAEARRIETERKQAETQQLVRMQAAAPRMFDMLVRACAALAEDGNELAGEVETLINEIEGDA